MTFVFLSKYILCYLHISLENSKILPYPIAMVTEGEDLLLHCSSLGPVIWTFNEGNLPNNALVESFNSQMLKIERSSEANSGSYECKGRKERNEMFYARTRVIIQGKLSNI